jgi:hypothetical protein
MPTERHNFDNRSNGYGCLNTALVRSLIVADILLRGDLEDLPWAWTTKLTSF